MPRRLFTLCPLRACLPSKDGIVKLCMIVLHAAALALPAASCLEDNRQIGAIDDTATVAENNVQLLQIVPVSLSSDVAVDTSLEMTFDRPLDESVAGTVSIGDLDLSQTNAAITTAGNTVTARPDNGFKYAALFQQLTLTGFYLADGGKMIFQMPGYTFTTAAAELVIEVSWARFQSDVWNSSGTTRLLCGNGSSMATPSISDNAGYFEGLAYNCQSGSENQYINFSVQGLTTGTYQSASSDSALVWLFDTGVFFSSADTGGSVTISVDHVEEEGGSVAGSISGKITRSATGEHINITSGSYTLKRVSGPLW